MAILKAGADINVQDKDGETAGDFIFFFFVYRGKRLVIELTMLRGTEG